MKQSLRDALLVLLLCGIVAALFSFIGYHLFFRWINRDLEARSSVIAQALGPQVERLLAANDNASVAGQLNQMTTDERLEALALCSGMELLATSALFVGINPCERSQLDAIVEQRPELLVSRQTFGSVENLTLIVVHSTRYADRRMNSTGYFIFIFLFAVSLAASALSFFLSRHALKRWQSGLKEFVEKRGSNTRPMLKAFPELKPLLREIRSLIKEYESERGFVSDGKVLWSPSLLKEILTDRLSGDRIIVVANREPYIHAHTPQGIVVQNPASGLVSALEPVMRACSGTWIAHGSGSADKETVDENDRVRVPPEAPCYQIRRLWLTEEQERGYYYGFSNEGIWPLCHIAYTRPVFRPEDWEAYKEVNELFANAVIEESDRDNPIVLVQDYHFALVPALVRKQLPKATIISFWHIPWPNPEAFGICPWQAELLEGMLGSTIVGFHTRQHCNNFLETVDKVLESRIDWEAASVSFRGSQTTIRSYPISVEFEPDAVKNAPSIKDCENLVRMKHGIPEHVALLVGVERLDYTKGILERFYALERLLEIDPELKGNVCLIQVASPSRSVLTTYSSFAQEVRALAQKLNDKYSYDGAPIIILMEEHHSTRQVVEYLRACRVCIVSSLHDGMNLVAKEYVAARTDGSGVLILSQFTGAAGEFPEALIVNPYDVQQVADVIRIAISMSSTESTHRMNSMREQLKVNNVYRWAGRMLADASQVRRRALLEDLVNS